MFRQQTQKPVHRQNLSLSLEDIYKGKTVKMTIRNQVECTFCITPCENCHGSGKVVVQRQQGFMLIQQITPCAKCSGTGKRHKEQPCTVCNQKRFVEKTKDVEVIALPGVQDDHTILFKDSISIQQKNADLQICIKSNPHPLFKRSGNNLHLELTVNVLEAIHGWKRLIPHVSGKVLLLQSGSVNPEQVFEIKEWGMPTMGNPSVKGFLYIKVHVNIKDYVSILKTYIPQVSYSSEMKGDETIILS